MVLVLSGPMPRESRRAALGRLAVISYVALTLLFIVHLVENRIRHKKNDKLPPGANPTKLTDIEKPEFRYDY